LCAHADSDTYSKPNGDTYSDTNSDCNRNSDCNSHANRDLNPHAYAHAMHRKVYADTPTTSDSGTASVIPLRIADGMDAYEVRPRKDKRGVDLISDTLPFGRLWYQQVPDAVDYAKFYSRSDHAVICVFDSAGNVIETHEQAGDFKEW